MHLPDLVDMTADPADPASAESLNAINVRLADPQNASSFWSALASRSPGIAVRSTARAQDGSDPFAVLERFHMAIAIVTVHRQHRVSAGADGDARGRAARNDRHLRLIGVSAAIDPARSAASKAC